MALRPLLEHRVGNLRNSLLLLVGAVGLVLLVACVNLANLMLARGVARFGELAVRLALGATPGRLARGVFLESIVLAVTGGALGAGLAAAGLPLLAPAFRRASCRARRPSGWTAARWRSRSAFPVLTGLVFGLLPAWQVLRANVNETLKSGGSRGGTNRFAGRAQAALIAGQVALTLMVLSGAGLLAHSLLNLQRTNPGFDPTDVLTLRVAPPETRWADFVGLSAYYDRLLDEVRRLPGVEAAAFDSSAPLCGITLRYPFWVQGRPRAEGSADDAVFNAVSPDFLKTLRIPLMRGRFIAADGRARGPQGLRHQPDPREPPLSRREPARQAHPDGRLPGARLPRGGRRRRRR
jgi:hypothetical protein